MTLRTAVVIATYERPLLLDAALTAWEASDPVPDQLIVVDASSRAERAAAEARRVHPAPFARGGWEYCCVDVASTTRQRNLGLDRVEAEVVVFADDDTLPGPGYLARLVEVFALDEDGAVGGVAGTADRSAEGWAARLGRPLVRAGAGRFVGRYATARALGMPSSVVVPPLPPELHVTRARALNGCNMAFRTELAKEERFDEHMHGWAYGEDFDLSFRIGRHHALVRRADAPVRLAARHGSTVDPDRFFAIRWVNPAYLIAKLDLGPTAWRGLHRLWLVERTRDLARGRTVARRGRGEVGASYAAVERWIAELRDAPDRAALVDRYERIQASLDGAAPPAPEGSVARI